MYGKSVVTGVVEVGSGLVGVVELVGVWSGAVAGRVDAWSAAGVGVGTESTVDRGVMVGAVVVAVGVGSGSGHG